MKSSLLVAAVMLMISPAAEASLIHLYQFQNTLADSVGGPTLTTLGGLVGAGQYTFGAGQGLSLSDGLVASQNATYSIVMNVLFETVVGFRKLLDFKNLSVDSGLYNLNTALILYPSAYGSGGALTVGTYAQVVVTRNNATGIFTGYVNGLQQIQFTDASAATVFDTANNIITFFKDDNQSGGREASAGIVREIRIYDVALSANEVAAITSVPEPATSLLTALALLLSVRRQTAKTAFPVLNRVGLTRT